jgi:hypothetical protein
MGRSLLFGILAAIVASGLAAAADPSPTPAVKILLIGHKPDHPYGTHMYLEECRLLAKCLEQTKGVRAIVSDGWPKDPTALENVRSIAFYSSPGGAILLAPERRAIAEKLLADGVGLVAIHWGTGAAPEIGERYQKALGGWFDTSFAGLNTTTAKLKQVAPDHPVCFGWKEYDLRDEFYLNLRFEPQARPILQVTVGGKPQTVAWAFERAGAKGGRSFGITLGHFHDNFAIPAFRRAIVNGILWTARAEVPPEGAPVEASAKDLELPKPPPAAK